MNNSYLCWLLCAPPLPAPHTLFVAVLFSSCERTQHLTLHSHQDGQEFWLFAAPQEVTYLSAFYRIYFYISITPWQNNLHALLLLLLLAFAPTKPGIIAKNGFAFNKSVTKEPRL